MPTVPVPELRHFEFRTRQGDLAATAVSRTACKKTGREVFDQRLRVVLLTCCRKDQTAEQFRGVAGLGSSNMNHSMVQLMLPAIIMLQ